MTRTLVLCADDFAQSAPISEGILRLLAQRRLSAVSVMSGAPLWPDLAPELAAFAGRADIGLHFNLTEAFDGEPAPHGLNGLLLASSLRLLSVGTLRQLCLEQIDDFRKYAGQLPDFIDGHQHVHALPQVRQALFEAIALRWPDGRRPYLRAPDLLGTSADDWLKYLVLRVTCGGFTGQARRRGLPVAPWFGGMYSFASDADYSGLMERWLALAPAQGLLMCHPGLPSSGSGDPIARQRVREFDYLRSDAFGDALARHGVQLGRLAGAIA